MDLKDTKLETERLVRRGWNQAGDNWVEGSEQRYVFFFKAAFIQLVTNKAYTNASDLDDWIDGDREFTKVGPAESSSDSGWQHVGWWIWGTLTSRCLRFAMWSSSLESENNLKFRERPGLEMEMWVLSVCGSRWDHSGREVKGEKRWGLGTKPWGILPDRRQGRMSLPRSLGKPGAEEGRVSRSSKSPMMSVQCGGHMRWGHDVPLVWPLFSHGFFGKKGSVERKGLDRMAESFVCMAVKEEWRVSQGVFTYKSLQNHSFKSNPKLW